MVLGRAALLALLLPCAARAFGVARPLRTVAARAARSPVASRVRACGILAVFDSTLPADDLRLKALQLQRMIRHRGPDGSGVHLTESSVPGRRHVVAHERLAINGGVGGNQPLYSHDGLAALSINGEIYNHVQLRSQLSDSRPFATGSDCEVVVHGYREWGLDVASKLDGDFAFVIVDEKTGELYAARDHIGINSLYFGYGHDGSLWFASEMKAIVSSCERVMVFPPGHYYSSRTRQLHKYYAPKWTQVAHAKQPLDLKAVRETFEAAVTKRLMAEVPYGVLLSGGLDSSLVASLVAKQYGDSPQRLNTFSVGLVGSPDLAAAQRVADFLGTTHHSFTFTVQEGLDAISDVIYHLETYDVTTIRAGTPMFLLARKIKGLGIKMVLSGEGSDEALAGYLYFHKAPNGQALHEECVRKLGMLHLYDCLRANKATMAWGLEVRVPFLDKDFLEVAMSTDPEFKLTKPKGSETQHIEKWLMRKAFDEDQVPGVKYLPKEVLWRQKEQFSDGVGYSWIDGLKAHCARVISDEEFMTAKQRFPLNTPPTKEAYYLRSIFQSHFPHWSAAATVPGGPSIACSSAVAIEWDAAWKGMADPSGRAIGSHDSALAQPAAPAAAPAAVSK